MRKHYTEEQANAILRRAIERMPMKDEMSRDQLESIATELGVSPDALQKAEADWEAEEIDKADRKAFISHRRRGFRRHLQIYAMVNLFLFLLALAAHENDVVALFFTSLVGWGIGLSIHAAFALRTGGEDFEMRFTRWRIQRRAHELAAEELARLPYPR